MERKKDSFFLNQKQQKPMKVENKINDTVKGKNEHLEENQHTKDKKPFDKKTYRLKKYSKKYKLDQWEEQRKKKLLRDYYKEVKDDPLTGSYKPVSFDEDTVDANESVGKYVKHPDLLVMDNPSVEKKKDPYQQAKEQYQKIKFDKQRQQEDMQKMREEKNKKLQEYKKKKQERFKKLSKKNKKGQPMMKGRLELMLEKIQKEK